jgi:hypothetical protein
MTIEGVACLRRTHKHVDMNNMNSTKRLSYDRVYYCSGVGLKILLGSGNPFVLGGMDSSLET